jgi:hypothetical protein
MKRQFLSVEGWFIWRRGIRGMPVLSRILLGLSMATIFCFAAGAQTPSTENEIDPEVDAHIQFHSNVRLLAIGGVEQGIGFPYQQSYGGAGLGYQVKRILRSHIESIDPDKEHYFVFGGGYEFLRTVQSEEVKDENRIIIEGTSGLRLPAGFLVRDRNRVELRWQDGSYSTRYRNLVTAERDFIVHGFHFIPSGSAEFFYDGSNHSWNEEWYTAGVQVPYKRLWMLETFYRRENCDTCNPTNWNETGLTLNFYFGSSK